MKCTGTVFLLILAFGLVVWGTVGDMALGQTTRIPSPMSVDTPGGPGATFDGTIQPLPPECHTPVPTWDPYAPPGTPTAPDPLWQSDPNFQSGAYALPAVTFATATKFLQEVRIDYLWMPGTASREFGINDIEATATFAIPVFSNPETPLLITPGFAVHLWNGPTGLSAAGVHMPAHVYDAYLDAAWNPQIAPWLGGELSFRVGVYSDYKKWTSDAIRYTGTGLMRVSVTPSFEIKGGIWYLHRQRIKLLPAGGVVWKPNGNIQCDIVFPNPKLARRLGMVGTTEWWGYLRGEYGGGSWNIDLPGIGVEQLDYNDIRAALGVDFSTMGRCNGLFEVGLAFEREIYHTDWKDFELNTTVFLRGGLAY